MQYDTVTIPDTLRSLTVAPTLPIIDAVQVLNRAHKRIVAIVDEDGRLIGILTDSNIRHAVLDRIDFGRPVSEIMVRQPLTVPESTSEEQVLALMEKTTLYQIPALDECGRLVRIHFLDDLLHRRGRRAPRVAVVMAGGPGERLRPLTDNTPKPLLTVGDRPILFVILDSLLAAGFDRIYITINYLAERIRDAVAATGRYSHVVSFIEEKERLGTAGALSLLPETPTEPFLVINADLLMRVALDEMVRFHEHEKNSVTVALKEESYIIPYGVATLEGTRIVGMKEKPEMKAFINAGVYVIDPLALGLIPRGSPFDMTDVIKATIEAGRRVGCFPVHEYWQDIGRPTQLEQARQDYSTVFPGSKAPGT